MTKREIQVLYIKKMMKEKGYTNKTFAEKLGYTEATFKSNMTTYKNTRERLRTFLGNVAGGLGMELSELLEEFKNLDYSLKKEEEVSRYGYSILRRHRLANGYSFKALAKATGKSVGYLSAIEYKRHPYPSTEFGDELIELLNIQGDDKRILNMYKKSREELIQEILRLEDEIKKVKGRE